MATMAQQMAIANETKPQYLSRFDLEAKLANVPTVNSPVSIHIPSFPVPGTQLTSMTLAVARTNTIKAG